MRSGPKLKVLGKEQTKDIVGMLAAGVPMRVVVNVVHMDMTTIRRNIVQQYGEARYRELMDDHLTHRFKKGHVPWNTGLKVTLCPKEKSIFKEGHMRGTAARMWRPVGTIVVRKKKVPKCERRKGASRINRRRYIKIADKRPARENHRNWIAYARYLWQEANGPIPAGMCIVPLDGNLMNDSLDNLFMMTRVNYLDYIRKRFPERDEEWRRHQSQARTGYRKVELLYRNIRQCKDCSADLPNEVERCPKCGSCIIIEERVRVGGKNVCDGDKPETDAEIPATALQNGSML